MGVADAQGRSWSWLAWAAGRPVHQGLLATFAAIRGRLFVAYATSETFLSTYALILCTCEG